MERHPLPKGATSLIDVKILVGQNEWARQRDPDFFFIFTPQGFGREA